VFFTALNQTGSLKKLDIYWLRLEKAYTRQGTVLVSAAPCPFSIFLIG